MGGDPCRRAQPPGSLKRIFVPVSFTTIPYLESATAGNVPPGGVIVLGAWRRVALRGRHISTMFGVDSFAVGAVFCGQSMKSAGNFLRIVRAIRDDCAIMRVASAFARSIESWSGSLIDSGEVIITAELSR